MTHDTDPQPGFEQPGCSQLYVGQLDQASVLVTGGAGFIGSNLVDRLIQHDVGKVRILDNLSEGKLENIAPYLSRPNVEFVEGDITDKAVCQRSCEGIDFVSHQAALGSVPRSLVDPVATHQANVTGFVNMITAAKDAKVKRFVYASSSSVYGDSPALPKRESDTGRPLSPYAVSKRVNELYADVFALNYGFEVIGLRYFNVYGPRQKADGPYAAAIPLFMDALLSDRSPVIHGDGQQSRDFTFIWSAVDANMRAMFTAPTSATGRVYNIAHGCRTTINELFETLRDLIGTQLPPRYVQARSGDVRHSLADISAATDQLGYRPTVMLADGLRRTLNWATCDAS